MRRQYPADADWRPYGHFLPDHRTWTQRHSLYIDKQRSKQDQSVEEQKYHLTRTINRLYPANSVPLSSRSLPDVAEIYGSNSNLSINEMLQGSTISESVDHSSPDVEDGESIEARKAKDESGSETARNKPNAIKSQCFALMTDRKDLATLHENLLREKRLRAAMRHSNKTDGADSTQKRRQEIQLTGRSLTRRVDPANSFVEHKLYDTPNSHKNGDIMYRLPRLGPLSTR